MNRFLWCHAWLVFILFISIPGASIAPGEDGLDFAGFYKLGESIDLGQNVQVKITVRIRNCSGFDISNGIVTLEEPFLPGKVLGIFAERFSAPYGEMRQFEGDFTVPKLLYQEWLTFQKPCIRVTYTNVDGHETLRVVQLSRRWIEEQEG